MEEIDDNDIIPSNIINDKKTEDKLLIASNLIKQDIHSFIDKSEKRGFYFNVKINEKRRKIKIFVTLLNSSDTNVRNEDIEFLIEAGEEYPQKSPFVFCMSCVKFKFIINI